MEVFSLHDPQGSKAGEKMKPVKIFIHRYDVHQLMMRLTTQKDEGKRERRRLTMSAPAEDKTYWNGYVEATERARRLIVQYIGSVAEHKQERKRK